MPVHPGAERVAQDWTSVTAADRAVDGPCHSWRERDEDDLAALAANAHHAVTVLLAEVTNVGAAGFEDP
jgi:hypothetical protein